MAIQGQFAGIGNFPAGDVEECLRKALAKEQHNQEILRPSITSACTPEIDSLVVVELICAVEELLGVSLPPTFVPRGGYEDVETCIDSIVTEARSVWPELVKQEEEHHA